MAGTIVDAALLARPTALLEARDTSIGDPAMNEIDIATCLRDAMLVVVKCGGPVLIAALIVGLVTSLVQAVTQIHEQTLAFLPKAAVVCGTLMLLGPFMQSTLLRFAHEIFDRLVVVGGS